MAKAGPKTLSPEAAKRQLKRLFANRDMTSIEWHYQVGKLVEVLHPTKDGRSYGSSTIQDLADDIQEGGPKSWPSVLIHARKFANLYSPSEVKALARHKDAKGQPLGWQRMAPLLSLQDAQKRSQLLDCCLANSWTVQDMQFQVQQTRPAGKKGKGGRRPTVSKSLPKLLADLTRLGERWIRWGDQLGLVDDVTACEPAAERLDGLVRTKFIGARTQVAEFLAAVKQQADRRGTKKPKPVLPTSKKKARRRKFIIEDRWGR